MDAVAIITARGGSKRIPGKNLREFCGKPILAYGIEAALESGLFQEVMVSTDSEEIAAAARRYGAATPFPRGAETSNDYATTADVLLEVLECYRQAGRSFEALCCIYPTAPFLTAEKLRSACSAFMEAGADSLVPVVRFDFPPQRAFVVRNERLVYQYPQYAMTRSQDLEPIYHDSGQFYFCRTAAFLRCRTLITPDTVPFVLNPEEVQDIDTLSDWVIAEEKYRVWSRKKGGKIPDVSPV